MRQSLTQKRGLARRKPQRQLDALRFSAVQNEVHLAASREDRQVVTPNGAKNPSMSKTSSQPFRPICHSPPISPSPSSTPGRPGSLSNSLEPPPVSDTPVCKKKCCFSPVC